MELELISKIDTKSKEKKNFDFVDTIRCISMIGIVFEHCNAIGNGIYHSTSDRIVEASAIQFFKFSTIAFFLIGGFLINHKFQEYTAGQYLRNRFQSTVRPWLFWLLMFIVLTVVDRYVAGLRGSYNPVAGNFFTYIGELFVFSLFYTPYWFILNFLICICVLLVFKKYLYNWSFGVLLAGLSLVYSLNIYHEWFVSNHSAALLGFVFYLWLGVILNRYFDEVMAYIKKTSWLVMILGVITLFVFSLLESFKLVGIGAIDPYNTLRITNVFYSLGMFALLLKMGTLNSLQKALEPRKTTFGIYLVHFVLIMRFLPLIFQPLQLDYRSYSVWTNTGIHILRFFMVYGLSFLLVRMIQRTRCKWIVGN